MLFYILLFPFIGYGTSVQDVNRALNNIKTLESSFLQSSNGQTVSGSLFIKRPGYVKIAYGSSNAFYIISDGNVCVFKDPLSDRPLYLSVDRLPFKKLFGKKTQLQEDFTVKVLDTLEGVTVNLLAKDYPYTIDLYLDKSHTFLGWRTIDAEGNTVRVHLKSKHINQELPSGIFKIQKQIFQKRKH